MSPTDWRGHYIVVNIETQLGDRTALQNLVGNFRTNLLRRNHRKLAAQLAASRFYLRAGFSQLHDFRFYEGQKIVELGYAGAQSKIALLKSLALDDAEWQNHLAERRAKARPDVKIVPEFLAIEGTSAPGAKSKIERELAADTKDKSLDKRLWRRI
jgi:hypothetical protein